MFGLFLTLLSSCKGDICCWHNKHDYSIFPHSCKTNKQKQKNNIKLVYMHHNEHFHTRVVNGVKKNDFAEFHL